MLRSLNAFFVRVGLFGALLFLGACGGGGSGGETATTPVPPSGSEGLARPGIYIGEVTSPASSTPPNVLLLLSPSGRAVAFIDTTSLVTTTLSFSNGLSATAAGKIFLTSGATSGSEDLTVTGEFQSASDLTLDLTSSTSEVVMTFKRANDSSDRGLAIADIVRTFTLTGSGTTEFTVGADGTLSGSDTAGCVFAGEVTIPEPAINVFDIDFTADMCGGNVGPANDVRNGTFAGVGTYLPDDGTGTGDLLMFGVADTDIAAIFSGE